MLTEATQHIETHMPPYKTFQTRFRPPKWRRTSRTSSVDILTKNKILPGKPRHVLGVRTGHCSASFVQVRRWSYKRCRHCLNPHHPHPWFQQCRGPRLRLQVRAAVLLLELAEGKKDKIHKLLDVNHKAVESLDDRLSEVRKSWVEQKQKARRLAMAFHPQSTHSS